MAPPRLAEAHLRREIWPRFSRVMKRDEIYLANHSLGRPPDRMAEDVRAALDAWYRDMDGVTDRHEGAGFDRRNGATWRGLKVAFRTVRRMG